MLRLEIAFIFRNSTKVLSWFVESFLKPLALQGKDILKNMHF